MNSKKLHWLLFVLSVNLLVFFTACETEKIEIEPQADTQILYVDPDFDLSPLLNSEIPEIRERANSFIINTVRSIPGVEFRYTPTGTIINGTGTTVTISATGIFLNPIPIKISDPYNDVVVAEELILWNGSTGGTISILIDPYFEKNGSPRYLMVEYFDGTRWVGLKAYAQEAIPMEFESNMDDHIDKEGNTYTITQLGYYPASFPDMVRFQAVSVNNQLISNNVLMAPPNKTTSITIFDNQDDLPRIVYLQFYLEEIDEWVTFETAIQLGIGTSSNIITLSKVELCGIEPTGGYIHVYVWGDPAELNAGDQIPIRIKGFSNVLLTTTTIVEGTAIWGATLPNLYPHASTGYHGSTVLEIPTLENNGWGAYYELNLDQRYTPYISWTFEYYDGEQWRELSPTFGQNNYFLGVNNTATILTADGGDWNLLVTGSFPAGLIVFRAVNEFNMVISNGNVTLPALGGGNQARLVPISILPNNTGSTRYVYLEYSINGGAFTKWHKGINPTPYWSGNNYIIQTN